MAGREPRPKTFVVYIRAAQALVRNTKELDWGVEKFASGMIRLADIIGNVNSLKRRKRAHRTVLDQLEDQEAQRKQYQKLVIFFLTLRDTVSLKDWTDARPYLEAIGSTLCDDLSCIETAEAFLDWSSGSSTSRASMVSASNNPGPNLHRVNNGTRHVDIRLGSIHSVKGQTHLATLMLSTHWHDHSSERMLPWLLGERENGDGTGSRDRTQLLQTYVAMTRPSHLLCLAIPHKSFERLGTLQAGITALKQRNWVVAELINGAAQWK